jgi:hypothetical protein
LIVHAAFNLVLQDYQLVDSLFEASIAWGREIGRWDGRGLSFWGVRGTAKKE